ncbi:MAG: hypothetical protein PVJ49_11625 [Acidobacteriota bacterium]|jgi:hypothetical protein
MMLASSEVRWFFPGDPPEEVTSWFFAGVAPAGRARRVDRYLLMPGCDTVGIKLREGRFEVKARCGPSEACAYPHGVRGRQAAWIKWSRAVDDRRPPVPGGEERWVAVAKRRSLRGFALAGGANDPQEIDARGARPTRGCSVEITRVELIDAESSRWWSLGFEAFDEHGDGREPLERAARFLFGETPPPLTLTSEASMAYPEWLLRHAPDSGREV